MAVRTRVAKRYAHALFEAARERNLLEVVETDLHFLEAEYHQVPEFKKLIDSPVIPNPAKQQAFRATFAGKLSEVTTNFMLLLFAKNRESALLSIIEHFRRLMDEHRGILRGVVYAAISLSEDQLSALKARLDEQTGKNVLLTQQVDPALLAGFVVKIQDQVIDTSLRHQLEKLRDHLIQEA